MAVNVAIHSHSGGLEEQKNIRRHQGSSQHLFPSARFVSKNPHSTVVGLVAHLEGMSWDVFVVNSGSTLPGGGGAWTDFFDEWRKQAAVAANGYLKA
jgi:hypothetical protein